MGKHNLGITVSQVDNPREYQRQYRALKGTPKNDPGTKRRYNWFKRYGITPEEYDKLYVAQDGKCAICEATRGSDTAEYLCVDHCHETGAIRGLLCNSCNRGIGNLKDSVQLVTKALAYLTR